MMVFPSSSARFTRAMKMPSASARCWPSWCRGCAPVNRPRARRHQPDHRRRGSRPVGAVARRVRALAAQVAQAHLAVAGLAWRCRPTRPLALELGATWSLHWRAAPAAPHVPPGQGRVLGRRDQAGPTGAGPAGLPGVHPQTPHRMSLPPAPARCWPATPFHPQFATHNAGTIAACCRWRCGNWR